MSWRQNIGLTITECTDCKSAPAGEISKTENDSGLAKDSIYQCERCDGFFNYKMEEEKVVDTSKVSKKKIPTHYIDNK